MRRAFVCAVVVLLVFAVAAAPALAHSAFLGSDPEPGQRLGKSPRQVSLTFTEPLNDRLSRATLVRASDGRPAPGVQIGASGKRLVLTATQALGRMTLSTVSTEDGHALEGSFSFGVRAPAVGGEHDVEQSPFARDGWIRIAARTGMYATLLLLSGALLLDVLLSRRRTLWLAPESLSGDVPGLDRDGVERRHQRLIVDVGVVAVAAAAFRAVADAADAAGGVSARGLSDFLLGNLAGLNRLYVVAFAALALVGAALRVRTAALAALVALAAVALSGHANAASPRGLAVAVDWVHLVATAVWLGGIAVIVIVWWPILRRGTQAERLAIARRVLPRFGQVALPAFAVLVVTGLVSAIIELGHLPALWETDYGRVLAIKVALVALIAAASGVHALRLRPRLLRANPHPDERLERRHWRLLRAEPLLGVGVVVAVAVLVAFPLPPRQLGDAGEAVAAPPAACDPCPLPKPATGELAVAEQGGSNVVAAWARRDGGGLAGTVRMYGRDRRSPSDPFRVLGAAQSSCGPGCARFRLASQPSILRVQVRQRGRSHVARLPVRWRAGQEREARRLVARAQAVMRELRTVRETERVSSVPGVYAVTDYRLQAPNRFAYRTNGAVESIVVGKRQWTRAGAHGRWQRSEYGGGLAFRTRSWFTWTTYARYAYLLAERREAGRRVAVLALMDPGTPAWWRLAIDLRTHRILHSRLVTYGHFMTQRFFAADQPLSIRPPPGATP